MLLKILYVINKHFPSALLACPNNICLSGLQHFEAFLPSKNEEQTTPPFLRFWKNVYFYMNNSCATAIVQKQGTEIVQKQGTEIVQNSGLIKSEALSAQIPDNCIGKAGPGTYYSSAISNTLRLCKLTLIVIARRLLLFHLA